MELIFSLINMIFAAYIRERQRAVEAGQNVEVWDAKWREYTKLEFREPHMQVEPDPK